MAKYIQVECETTLTLLDNRCDCCGKEVRRVFDADNDQFEDALIIQFVVGYGMYYDYAVARINPKVLCKECADKLRAEYPYLFEEE